MGNGQTQIKKAFLELDTSKFDTLIKQIYFTARLQQDRRRGSLTLKEKEFINSINQEINKRDIKDEIRKVDSMLGDARMIKALEIIMRYCDVLKDHVGTIKHSKGDINKIRELLPYIKSIIWGCERCNIEAGAEISKFISHMFFSGNEQREEQISECFDSELENCFRPILASEDQIKQFLVEFCTKHGVDLAKLNAVGHNLILVEPKTTIISTPKDYIEDCISTFSGDTFGMNSRATAKFPSQGNIQQVSPINNLSNFNVHINSKMSFGSSMHMGGPSYDHSTGISSNDNSISPSERNNKGKGARPPNDNFQNIKRNY